MKLSRRHVLALVEITTTLAILAAIWIYTESNPSFAVPPLSDALHEFQRAWLFDRIGSDVVPTLVRLLAGYSISVLIGILLGLALGSSRVLRLLLQPAMTLLRSIPAVALIPPLVIVLGIGDSMKLVLVVVVCIWPIVLNTADGVLQLDETMRSTARSYRLSRLERLRFVLLPGISPRIFAGMRTSLALALILVIASEYLAGTDGVGFFVGQAQQTYDVASMWAGIILLGIIGYALNAVFLVLQRRALHWQPSAQAER